MDLYIAEKPSLAEAIAEGLPGAKNKNRTHITAGNSAVLTWCFGHLLEQVRPEDYDERFATWSMEHLPIIPKRWKVQPVKKTAAQLTAIKGLLASATRVIHAGDPDQEGQLIVDEVLAYLGNTKPVLRLLVNDYSGAKVREALASMQPNTVAQFQGWSSWATCRSRLDWLIGMNLSRAYTLMARKGGFDGVLSVGRVQSPTLAIVVARDATIESFVSRPFYALQATVEARGTAFRANWKPKDSQAGLDDDGRLIDAGIAAALSARLSKAAAIVTAFEADAKKRAQPLPYYIDTLQMAANERFGYTAAQTLEAAQSLYETHKLTTYPRTDCAYLSRAQHAESPARLSAVAGIVPGLAAAVAGANVGIVSAAFNDAKVTAHHGIVPTVNERAIAGTALSERERNVYTLIATNFLAQFYPPEEYEQTRIELDIGGEVFAVTGKRVTSPGWTVLVKESEPESDTSEDAGAALQSLPRVTKGEQVQNRGVSQIAKKTSPPKHFTEATLLQAMADVHKLVTDPAAKARLKEGQGIGTPATRASILEELKRREYVNAKGRQLVSTTTGRGLVAALPRVATDPAFTGITEQTLDQVAKGRIAPDAFMAKTAELIGSLVKQAAATPITVRSGPVVPCPVCKKGQLRRRKSAKGHFWGCDRYSAADDGCKATYEDARGKPRLAGAKPSASGAGGVKKRTARKTATKTATKRVSRSATKVER